MAESARIAARTTTVATPMLVRLAAGLALSAASATLLVVAFPPFGLGPLVFVAFVPMLVAQFRVLPPRASSLASAIAVGGWVWGFFGPIFADVGTVMRYLPLMVFAITLLLDVGLRAFHVRTGYRWFVLSGASTWVGIEMIRGMIPSFGTWGFLAYTLHDLTWAIQPVAWFGVYGLGLLIVAVNYAVAQAVLASLGRRGAVDGEAPPAPPRAGRRLAVVGIALAGWIGLSLVLLEAPPSTVRVAAVQPSTSPLLEANLGRGEAVGAIHGRMVEQTVAAAADGARLIVWPEGALTFDPQVDDRLGLVDLARITGAYLAIGYVVDLPEGGFRNEATVIAPDGRFLGVFGKDHPVVFGGETSPTRGTYPVYATELGALATMICYDADFTDTARMLARGGAQLVAVPSQDWAGIASVHATHVVFRAIETRMAMVKADGSFDSAIVDPYGRVLASAVTPDGGEATLVADVPLGTGRSLAVAWGDWVGWASLVGFVAFAFAPAFRRRRR